VRLNLAFRDPLVPAEGHEGPWPEPLDGRPDGQPWTRFGVQRAAGGDVAGGWTADHEAGGRYTTAGARGSGGDVLELPWTERGAVVCGDGDYDALALVELAERAGWPVLAEPSSGARRGPNALSAYQQLLVTPEFITAYQPDLIISAGRPGLSRGQLAFLGARSAGRHVVIAQGPGRWADPPRAATDVTSAVRLAGVPVAPQDTRVSAWLAGWRTRRRARR
jgi:2-succinyl-5-enolpyruvyl-6-hydroxy-3-cyclohexene-1-carboxylate synthase